MTGAELKAIRQALGLSQSKMGPKLEYTGTRQSLASSIERLESGRRKIPRWREHLAIQLKESNQ